jgi:hypothetical protein
MTVCPDLRRPEKAARVVCGNQHILALIVARSVPDLVESSHISCSRFEVAAAFFFAPSGRFPSPDFAAEPAVLACVA